MVSEPVTTAYCDLESFARTAGPCIVRLPAEPSHFLALLGPGKPGLLNDLAPARDLALDETLQVSPRTRRGREHAEPDDLLLHLGNRERACQRGFKLVHHVFRCSSRHREHAPAGGIEAGDADFRDRRGPFQKILTASQFYC